jgi:hypothetical protein
MISRFARARVGPKLCAARHAAEKWVTAYSCKPLRRPSLLAGCAGSAGLLIALLKSVAFHLYPDPPATAVARTFAQSLVDRAAGRDRVAKIITTTCLGTVLEIRV